MHWYFSRILNFESMKFQAFQVCDPIRAAVTMLPSLVCTMMMNARAMMNIQAGQPHSSRRLSGKSLCFPALINLGIWSCGSLAFTQFDRSLACQLHDRRVLPRSTDSRYSFPVRRVQLGIMFRQEQCQQYLWTGNAVDMSCSHTCLAEFNRDV